MSLRVAGSIATSALRTAEVGMAVASSNVANASTDGYTRKTAVTTTSDTAVGISSVDIAAISSSVDQYLLKTLIGAQPDLGAAKVRNSYLDQFQQTLGDTTSDTGLGATIDGLAGTLATLATSPESASAKAATVQDLQEVAESLRSTSATVQDLRNQADDAIATTVDRINETLTTIDDLNDRILKAKGLGQDTGDLEDQRATALTALATDIDIRYQVDSNGSVRVSTASGTSLVDSTVHALSYTPAASVSGSTTFGPITIEGKDVTASIGSGTLGGLITLRDTDLPAQQARLDELATSLTDTLNAIHNQGTADPAPQTLTGTATVAATDALSATGTLRVALTDADGTATEALDIDLSTFSTVQDAVDAIDAIDGVSASISAEGKLVIQADDSSNGVALLGTDDAVGTDGEGFSAYFGLNDLLTGTGAADIQVADAIAADTGRLATGKLTDSGLTAGEGSIAQALAAAFTDSQSFDTAGGLAGRSGTFAAYAGAIVQGAASVAETAATAYDDQEAYADSLASTLASQSGVNVNEETAAITTLQSAYEAAAAVMQALQEMFDAALDMVR